MERSLSELQKQYNSSSKHGGFGGPGSSQPAGDGQTVFYMQDKVNFFSGLTPAR